MSTRKKIGSLLPEGASQEPPVNVDALAEALDSLSRVIKDFQSPEINVTLDELPEVTVNLPDRSAVKKMRFTVSRDKDGRIESIEAEIQS